MLIGIPSEHIYENGPIQLYRQAAPLGVIRYEFSNFRKTYDENLIKTRKNLFSGFFE